MNRVIPIKTYELDPSADLDFGFDLTADLGEDENIVDIDVSVSDPAILDWHDPATDGKIMIVFVRAQPGVTEGKELVTMHYTTDGVPPRSDDKSFWIFLRQG